jgi:hypothetical protein
MLTWPFQLAIVGFLIVMWIAQWLDWQSGIQRLAEMKPHRNDSPTIFTGV